MRIRFAIYCAMIPCLVFGDGDLSESNSRKHYGLSLNNGCSDYVKVFKCLTACKSMGFKIFRTDYICKCSCHEMKTSTILPYFQWGTNGTNRPVPKTQSPMLYHVVGTLSPSPPSYVSDEDTTKNTDSTDIHNTTEMGTDIKRTDGTTVADAKETPSVTDGGTINNDKGGKAKEADFEKADPSKDAFTPNAGENKVETKLDNDAPGD